MDTEIREIVLNATRELYENPRDSVGRTKLVCVLLGPGKNNSLFITLVGPNYNVFKVSYEDKTFELNTMPEPINRYNDKPLSEFLQSKFNSYKIKPVYEISLINHIGKTIKVYYDRTKEESVKRNLLNIPGFAQLPNDIQQKILISSGMTIKNKEYHFYDGKNRLVHTGPRGGKYIVLKRGEKVYIKHQN